MISMRTQKKANPLCACLHREVDMVCGKWAIVIDAETKAVRRRPANAPNRKSEEKGKFYAVLNARRTPCSLSLVEHELKLEKRASKSIRTTKTSTDPRSRHILDIGRAVETDCPHTADGRVMQIHPLAHYQPRARTHLFRGECARRGQFHVGCVLLDEVGTCWLRLHTHAHTTWAYPPARRRNVCVRVHTRGEDQGVNEGHIMGKRHTSGGRGGKVWGEGRGGGGGGAKKKRGKKPPKQK